MPFFAGKGYETYSVSLRGTSGTPIRGQEVAPPTIHSVYNLSALGCFFPAAVECHRDCEDVPRSRRARCGHAWRDCPVACVSFANRYRMTVVCDKGSVLAVITCQAASVT